MPTGGGQRSTIYTGHRVPVVSEEALLIRRLIDAKYTERQFYGSRRMVVILKRLGHVVNRKRVQRLMHTMRLAGMASGTTYDPASSGAQDIPVPVAWMPITRPNQVWSTNLTPHIMNSTITRTTSPRTVPVVLTITTLPRAEKPIPAYLPHAGKREGQNEWLGMPVHNFCFKNQPILGQYSIATNSPTLSP